MSGATLAFLGLSAEDIGAPAPVDWTPEALDMALRRLRALAGAQIRLRGADPMRGGGKNLVLCGRERTIGGGELLVEHVEWQVAHLHVMDGGALFDRALADLLAVDVAGLPEKSAGPADRGAATAGDWPVSQEIELVSASGACARVSIADVRAPQPLAAAVRALMAGVDAALAGATPFRTVGPRIEPQIPVCYRELVRRALLDSLRGERRDWFARTLRAAADGDLSAIDRLARPWPPTNSGVEVAQGNAALFLLGAAQRSRDTFAWDRQPAQPGSRLRRLVALASARPW